MEKLLAICVVVGLMLMPAVASANTVASSTMHFQGELTDNGDDTYSGVLAMIDEGGGDSGYDIYGEEGATAWFGNDPGSGPVWTSQAIVADHDGWPTWTPDTPDWYQYSLNLYVDGGQQKWAVRNHPGATQDNPWYDEAHWGAGGKTPCGVPMSGSMNWTTMFAAETDVGAYLPGTGTAEIPGGAAGYGGGPRAWDMDWSWGSEVVPLELPGFMVVIAPAGGDTYDVTLTPSAKPNPNTAASSTLIFEGSLTDQGGGIYTGTIPMTAGEYYVPGGPGETISDQGGFDVYAKEGGTAYVGPMTPDSWTIGPDHDAYSQAGPWGTWYDPDCPDWNQYSLELTADHWYLRYTATNESPMSGAMDWSNMYAAETDLGTQDGSHDGSAAHGGGAGAWDWDCGWGVEVVPLEFPTFSVEITDLGGGQYKVELTPTAVFTMTDGTVTADRQDSGTWGDWFGEIVSMFTIDAQNNSIEVSGKITGISNTDTSWVEIGLIPKDIWDYWQTAFSGNYKSAVFNKGLYVVHWSDDGLGLTLQEGWDDRTSATYTDDELFAWPLDSPAPLDPWEFAYQMYPTSSGNAYFSVTGEDMYGEQPWAYGNTPLGAMENDYSECYLIARIWSSTQNATFSFEDVQAVIVPAPATVWVDDDYCAGCSNDGHTWGYDAFDSIQEGIDAVEGSTVNVAAGTYNILSQILIDKSIDIVGDPLNNPVIHADMDFGSYMVKADSTVAATINMSNLVFDGSGHDVYAALRLYGVHNGTVEHCTFQNIVCAGYVGLGIVIYGDGFTFANNTFANIGRVGIWVGASTGSGCVITNNTYAGKGTGDWLDYAIEVGMGGIATITDNTITDCTGVASVDGSTSAGVLITTYFAPGTECSLYGNTLTGNTTGIAVGYDSSDTSVVVANNNNIFGNNAEGIDNTSATTIVNAEDNWWGDPTGPYHENGNHGLGDSVSDNVDYCPWLDAEYPGGSPISMGPVENLDTGVKYCTIKEAIDGALDGHTLYAQAGTYVESGQILIDKDLTIMGDPSDKPVVMTDQDTGNSVDSRAWFLVQPDYTLHIQDMVFDGSGHLIFQGFRHKGNGSFTNCTFRNIKYNESGPDYAGLAIVAFGGTGNPVDVTSCVFEEIGRVGVLYYGSGVSGSVYDNNVYTGKGDGDWLDYALDISAGVVMTVQNSTITNCTGVASVDGSTSAGVMITTLYGSGTECSLYNNIITDNTTGIAVGYDSSDTSVVVAHYNSIFGNNAEGIDNTSATVVVDAEYNWWGEFVGSGPYDGTGDNEVPACTDDPATEINIDGMGDAVSDNVDYCPWISYTSDSDADGINNFMDNCPSTANGPDFGTCVKTKGGMVASYRVGDPKSFITCTSDADCVSTGGTCQTEQGDCNENGCGDVCECYTDGNEDGMVSAPDYGLLKSEYLRSDCPLIPGSGTGDTDGDGVIDEEDNCPEHPNGSSLGTCVKTQGSMVVGFRVGDPKDFITCTSDADCVSTGGTCQMEQGDCNENGVGDVCECYTDGNEDGMVSAADYGLLKGEYLRSDCPPCP